MAEIIVHLDYRPTKECSNADSYGEICVKCNQCGRFSEKKQKVNPDNIVNKKGGDKS